MLPTPLDWVKKALRILKSNLSPNQIALGFALGIFAGLPPTGLHLLVPCTLALLVRCSFRSFLIAMGLFKLLSLGVAPAAFAIGTWCLDSSRGLDAFWRWIFQLPVLAPIGYARYLLFGSVVLSLILAIPVFVLVRLLVVHYRESFARWVAGWRISGRLRSVRGVGLARRFLAGGEAKYATVPPPRGLFRYVRRGMLVALPAAYGACYLLAAVIVPFFAGTIATSTASWIVGSEVTVKRSGFSLFSGGLTLDGLAVQDPNAPDENLVEIPRLALDAGMIPLLSKRVVFNRVRIADVSLHVKREPDGTLNIDNTPSGWDAAGYAQWAAEHAREVDWIGLLRRFAEYLQDVRPLAFRGDPYAPYRGGRSFAATRPPFSIDRIEIGRVRITLEDEFEPDSGALPPLTLLEVELGNLAFPADLRSGPIVVRLRGRWGDDPDSGFELSARFDGSDATIEFSVTRLDLPRLARVYATTVPLTVDSGWASMSGRLLLTDEAAAGDVSFLFEELQLIADSDRPLFGLPPETSERIVVGINRYADELPIVFGAAIVGPGDGPRLAWEAPLLEIAREGLMMTGERRLAATIDELGSRIEDLGGLEAAPMEPGYADLREETADAARRIIDREGEGPFDDRLPRSSDAASDDAGLLPDLLERILRPEAGAGNGDDPETEPE